jgi:hypothetical protein
LDGLLPSTVSTADIAKLWPLSDHTKIHYFPDKNFESEFFKIFILKQNFGIFGETTSKKKCFAKLGSFTSATEKTRELGDIRYEKKNFGNCSH